MLRQMCKMNDKRRKFRVCKRVYLLLVLLSVMLQGAACGALTRYAEGGTKNDAGMEFGRLESETDASESRESGKTDNLEETETFVTGQPEEEEGTEHSGESDTFEMIQAEQNSSGEPENIGEHPWVYDTFGDIINDYDDCGEEWGLPYVDDATFTVIREAYAEVDFNGEFETGAPEVYDAYRRRFWELLQGRGIIWDQETGKELTISEFMEETFYFDEYDPGNYYHYYFYDMDGDGCPDLGIDYSGPDFLYFFRYDKETDRFSVWYKMTGYWDQPIGSRKVMYTTSRRWNTYILLDENADIECETFFFSYPECAYSFLNMVIMPEYADKEREVEVTQEMKAQGAYVTDSGTWYFRITAEQYDELRAPFYEAFDESQRKIGEVGYSYDELFGDFIQEETQGVEAQPSS